MLKKILIFALKASIIVVLITFVFSSILVEVENVLKNTFANIYEYASPENKKITVDKFSSLCSSSKDVSQTAILGVQLCKDPSLLSKLEDNCARYLELKEIESVEVNLELEKTCNTLEKIRFDKYCNKLQNTVLVPDIEGMNKACEDYNDGTTKGKEFFVTYMSSAYGNIEISNSVFFRNYKNLVQFLDRYNALYIFIMLFLFGLLYLLIKDISLVFTVISKIIFNISLFLLLPYFVISSYIDNVGIHTDTLLNLLSQGGISLQANIFLGLLVIALFSFYNKALLTKLIILFIVGSIGIVHRHMMRKDKHKKVQSLKSETEKIKEK